MSDELQDTQDLLDAINKHVKKQGLTPKYKTVEEFKKKMKLNDIKVEDKLRRAYNYFIKETIEGR